MWLDFARRDLRPLSISDQVAGSNGLRVVGLSKSPRVEVSWSLGRIASRGRPRSGRGGEAPPPRRKQYQDAIVALAIEQPAFGQVRVADELSRRGLTVLPAGVRASVGAARSLGRKTRRRVQVY
jgi:hypothetical protein